MHPCIHYGRWEHSYSRYFQVLSCRQKAEVTSRCQLRSLHGPSGAAKKVREELATTMPRVLCTMQISGSKSSENTVWSEEIPSYCITPVGGGTKIFLPGSRGHSLQCTEVLCYGKRIEINDQGCPRCKTTKYRNPSLKLMVDVCGHTL